MDMKLWIGHFYQAPEEWFLVWGKTRDEAINYIDCEIGEPDVRSMKPVLIPGMMCFKATIEEEEDYEALEFTIRQDEFSLAEGDEQDKLNEWILKRMKNPLKEKSKDISYQAEHLGIDQPAVMKTYAEKCPHCGEKSYFGPETGCFQCGYRPGNSDQ